MSEHLAGWAGSAGHWLLAWTVVVAAVVALRAVCRPRRASVRYGGWLLATFSGVGLLLIVFAVSPVVTWKEIATRFGWLPSAQEGYLVKDLSARFEPNANHHDQSWPLGVGGESGAMTFQKEPATNGQPAANSISRTSAAAEKGQSAELVALVDKIRAARAELTSVSEEIRSVIIWGSKPGWLDRYECLRATFKMRGDSQFVANVDQIMRGPFRVGSDGSRCWWRFKDELFSCPSEEVAEKNVLFADPFGAGRPDDTAAVVRDLKLEYLGQVVLEGRLCHRIRSWDVDLRSNSGEITPVRDWYIDGESLLPVWIESDGLLSTAFHYKSVNQPIPDEEFQPETVQGIQTQEPEPLDEDYTRRFLNVIDGANGRMSVRWGKKGPRGWSSSGLN